MNRTLAIILTLATSLLCGLPGIGLICFAAVGYLGTNLPGFYEENPTATPEQAMIGVVTFVCVGLILLVIPVLVGVFSFRMSKTEESTSTIDYIPPAS